MREKFSVETAIRDIIDKAAELNLSVIMDSKEYDLSDEGIYKLYDYFIDNVEDFLDEDTHGQIVESVMFIQ